MFVSVELGPCILSNGFLKIAFSCWLLQCMFVLVELGPCILSNGIVQIAVSYWVLQQMCVSVQPVDRQDGRLARQLASLR